MKSAMHSFLTFNLALVALVCIFCVQPALAAGPDNPDPVQELMKWQERDVVRGELLVRFVPNAKASAQSALLARQNATLVREVADNLIKVRFDETKQTLDEAIAAYSREEGVEFVEPNQVYWPTGIPSDTKWNAQWGPHKIRCSYAWNHFKGDPNFVVSVIDTGVDIDHPDLEDHFAYGYDYYAMDSNPNDEAGHGSHTCGTAAADTDNDLGIAGVANECMFAAYRTGNYYLTDDAIISSVNDSVSQGAHVISMSFGSGSPSSNIEAALDAAYAAGVVNVASAGNNGNTNKKYPAAYGSVIAVASSTIQDMRSSFSTYGNWVDVAAPGSSIVSTYLNGGYASMNGTSMACPHVSGIAVFLYSMIGGNRTQAKADQIRNIIQDTSKHVGSWVIHGRVDMEAAVLTLAEIAEPVVTAIAPTEINAFQHGTITLTGTDLGTVSKISISDGTELFEGSGYSIIDNFKITLSAPTANTLGAHELTVTNPEGESTPVSFTYVETDPIKLSIPLFQHQGEMIYWDFAGCVGHDYFLIVGLDPTTVDINGHDVMINHLLVDWGTLDAVGLGDHELMPDPALKNLLFYSQFITVGNGSMAASNLSSSYIIEF